ncbi:hypothetical protein OEA41_001248 [Lepraria neglecta]|uniref:Uncharacterized protein n=1 Tax=Lepraria neglecta TaxID=209136 RepID=A0AAE0DQ66_9LECA|nr:hypothetical protein OEA41_001248 [Lepraria neglecta]
MNQDIINERKAKYTAISQEKESKKKEKEWSQELRRLRTIGPKLFAPPRPPATPRRRTPATQQPPSASLLQPISPLQQRRRLIVALRVRVSGQDLQQGRWAVQRQEPQESSAEQENQPMGRGQRVREPRKVIE